MLNDLTERVRKLVEGKDAIGFTVKFDLGDNGCVFVAGDATPMLVSNDDQDAELIFKMSADDLVALFDGNLNAMMAYMQGKLAVVGDISKAMQLSSLFG